MNFEKAFKELKAGKRIRRKEWEPLMHLVLISGKVKTFKSDYTLFDGYADIIMTEGWKIFNGDDQCYSFIEALELLKNKKCLINKSDDWPKDMFIFLDGDKLAACRPVEFNFMPTFKCFNSQDWEVMK